MRLLGLISAAGVAFAGSADAMDLAAQHAAARAAAFASQALDPSRLDLPPSPFVDLTGHGAPAWVSRTSMPGLGAADRVTLSAVSKRVTAGPVLRPPAAGELEAQSFDLSYHRSWPAAFSLAVGGYGFDVSPHAALGAGTSGRSVEAGLMARFGRDLEDSVNRRLGVREGGALGNQSRWYIFAASSGEAVGLNLMRRDGDWRRGGITKDSADALIGANQAGVGWRKGPMQASLGYVHREVKIRQGLEGLMGASDRKDDLVALSFSLKPNK